jgi:hypothetical protein
VYARKIFLRTITRRAHLPVPLLGRVGVGRWRARQRVVAPVGQADLLAPHLVNYFATLRPYTHERVLLQTTCRRPGASRMGRRWWRAGCGSSWG